jgi:hypothetical protein
MLSIAQIAQMKHWESFRSDRAETIKWMLKMLESDTDVLKDVHFALIKALGTILKQDKSGASEGIKLRQEDESAVLQPCLRENMAVEFNIAVANAWSDLGLFSEALVDWLQDEPSLIAEGTWPIRHVQFLCERLAVSNDYKRAVRLADSLLRRLHSFSFIQSDRLLLLKGLDNVRGLLSEDALSRMMLPFFEVGDAEQRARVLEAAVELKMEFDGQETSSNLARCLLLDVMPKKPSESTKIWLLSYILEKEGKECPESSLRENSAVFIFLLNSMQQSIGYSQSIVAGHLLEFEGAHDEQKNKQVEKAGPGQEGKEGGGKSDQPKRPIEPQAFYSRHSRADAELKSSNHHQLKCALDDLLKRFTPDFLEKASSTTTERACENYCAASLWTASGLLQDASAEKIATWLLLNKEDSVLVQDTYAALKHLQEPWLQGVTGANGEWEAQVLEMLQFEALGPFVFGILLSRIRDKRKKEPSSALEGFTLLSESIQKWDADTDDKRLERQFLLKELCIGRRDAQLPTWSGAVTKRKHAVPAALPMLDTSLLPAPAPMRSPFVVLIVGANMERHAQLKVREECVIIRRALQSKFGRDAWRPVAEFRADCFADPASFMHDVTEIGPGILQFCCDSEARGRWFAQGFKEASAIIDALRAHNRHVEAKGGQRIQLLVINACMSGPLAQALCECVDFVIGHAHGEVGDQEALSFCNTLYETLGYGRSLDRSFKAAKKASDPFHLYSQTFNPEHFLLPVPRQIQIDSDANELVRFLKGKGLSAIAARFSEAIGVESVTALGMLVAEDLEDPDLSFLKPWQKRLLMRLAQDITAKATTAAGDSGLDGSIDAVWGDGGDTAAGDTDSESGDDAGDIFDTVVAKHPGNPKDFQEHMKGFITDLLEYMSLAAPDEASQVFTVPVSGHNHEWSYCMLVWMRFAKDAYFDGIWREKWRECITFPSPDRLLAMLDSCLQQESTSHKWWTRAEFKRLGCNKPFAAAIFVTDVMVQQSLEGHAASGLAWQQDVVKSWFTNGEEASTFVLRANKFLREHFVNGTSAVTQVVETQ